MRCADAMSYDEVSIQQTINLYGVAIDARRWDLFTEVFTPYVHADYGANGEWHDRASLTAAFAQMHERYDHTHHAVSNHVIRVDGSRATAFAYVSWRLAVNSEDGWRGQEGNAWYDDVLVRADVGWRISDRQCRVTWSQPLAPTGSGHETLYDARTRLA